MGAGDGERKVHMVSWANISKTRKEGDLEFEL